MRLLALIPRPSDEPSRWSAARFALHRFLTRLGHVVSWAVVTDAPVEPERSPELGRMPHLAAAAPYAVRQLVRLALRNKSEAIVGAGDPTVDAIARGACAALGIPFIDELVDVAGFALVTG